MMFANRQALDTLPTPCRAASPEDHPEHPSMMNAQQRLPKKQITCASSWRSICTAAAWDWARRFLDDSGPYARSSTPCSRHTGDLKPARCLCSIVPLLHERTYMRMGRHKASSVAYVQLPVILRVWVHLAWKHDPVHNRAHLHPHLHLISKREDKHLTRSISTSETNDKAAAVKTSPCRRTIAVPSLHCLQWPQASCGQSSHLPQQ